MRIKFIIHSALLFLILSAEIFSQLKITLTSEKNEFNYRDSIIVFYTIENTSYERITFIDIGRFNLAERCWEIFSFSDNLLRGYSTKHSESDFKTLYPGEKIEIKRAISIWWVCRSMPEREKIQTHTFNYSLSIEEKDNYFILSDREGERKVNYNGAWTGSAESNSIEITIKKEDYR